MERRWISCPDTAKLVRAALKEKYASVKFRVRSSSYSGGASIHVEWTDGPTLHQVQGILHKYEGASFDGMTDSQSYHDGQLNGETVHFGADYVHGQRDISYAIVKKMADHVRDHYAVKYVPEPVDGKYGFFPNADWDNRFGNYTVTDFVMQQCYAYDATSGMMWDNSRRCLVPFDMEERHAENQAYYDGLAAVAELKRMQYEGSDNEFSQYAFGG